MGMAKVGFGKMEISSGEGTKWITTERLMTKERFEREMTTCKASNGQFPPEDQCLDVEEDVLKDGEDMRDCLINSRPGDDVVEIIYERARIAAKGDGR